MILKRIVFENFRKYRKFDVAITPGLIGIKGPNGSGKSSLLEGIYFGLTGSSLTDSTKGDMLRWGEKLGWVILEWDVDGTPVVIERWLGREKVTMTIGKEMIHGAKAANAAIARMLPVPPEYLRNVLFVAQEKLDEPLTGPESARKDGFGKLFGCSRFDRIRDILQEAISRYSGEAQTPSPQQLETLEKTLTTLDTQVQNCVDREKDLKEQLVGLDIPVFYRILNAPRQTDLVRRRECLVAKKEEVQRILDDYTEDEIREFDRPGLAHLDRQCRDMLHMATKGICPTCGQGTPPMTAEQEAEVRETISLVTQSLARIQAFDSAASSLITINNELDAIDRSGAVTDEEVEIAERGLANAKRLEASLRDTLSQRKFTEGRREGIVQAIGEHKIAAAKADKLKGVLDVLTQVRDAMHRDAVQRRVRAYGAGRINEQLDVFSSVFSIPYKVYFTEEGLMRFTDKASNTEHDFAELSGGQRKLVALTYRLALMRLFAQGLNLAVLDEPTAYIDEENVEAMRDAFISLDAFARKRNMTVFVATHEAVLLPVFPRVLEAGNV